MATIAFEQHRAVADRPGVGLDAQLLRRRARSDQRVKSRARAAGDRDEQKRNEAFRQSGRRRERPTGERRILNCVTAERARRCTAPPARRTESIRPDARAAAAAATPARRPRPGSSRAAARPKFCAHVGSSRNAASMRRQVERNLLADPDRDAHQRQKDHRRPAERQPRVAQQQTHDDRQHQVQQRRRGDAAARIDLSRRFSSVLHADERRRP